ncbi:MAG TPA: FAD/NAD(P)-binding protein [Gemmatimonadales bacterium]|nr:FAD/NAD(P)-binding protein [Gemmatimonadales bacterium]
MSHADDRDLGMGRSIPRRDFLNGLAFSLGAAALPRRALEIFSDAPFAPEHGGDYYPPALTGLRGSHPGSYEVAHKMRDGGAAAFLARARPTGETYDLVVVGAGISGLSAAHFYQQATGGRAKVLVLDNHDDFGGHAKRNEFRVGDKLLIGYGGTQSIDGPARYSAVARQLLVDLGIDTKRFYQAFDREFYQRQGLRGGIFFDRETFGADRLVAGVGRRDLSDLESSDAFKAAPLAEPVRRAIARLYGDKTTDYLAGLSDAEKKAKLAKTSYRDYLVTFVKLPAEALPYFQTMTHDLYGVGIDAVPALDCWGLDYPGFEGLKLERTGSAPGISLTAAPHEEEPYIFHFPDGNASIARLLVRQLVPAVGPGHTMDDIVTARFDYAQLDRAGAPTRIRLNSTAIRVRHLSPPTGGEVAVTYVRGDTVRTVRARACVLACWNGVIPYLCPELPAAQKEALAYGVKVPLVYTNVALRNWTAFKRLGISSVFAPGSYFTSLTLDFPVSMGRYHFARSPEDPIVVHVLRTPCKPGLPARQQHRAGRAELLATSFETFERELRSEFARILGAGGFDPARDIAGITVNRWPHGYAYEYNSLWDPAWPEDQQPCVVGRKQFGRITIANADAEAYAYTNAAIDQAHRAVSELLAAG